MKCLQGITMLTVLACVVLSVAAAENGTDKDELLKTCIEREKKLDPKVSDKGIQGVCDIKVNEEIERMTTEPPQETMPPTSRTTEPTQPPTTLPTTKNPPTIANESAEVLSSDSSPSASEAPTNAATAAPPTENTTETQASTIQSGVTDASSSSTVSNAQPTPAPESGDSSTLLWALPLLAVALVVMAVGGIFIYRYTKKAGYRHSNKPNGDTVNTKGGTDSSA